MITEEQAEKAVLYLRDSAKEYGQSRGYVAYCEGNLRRVKSMELLSSEGSLGEREAKAYASDSYLTALQELQNATAEYEILKSKREAASIACDVWRSMNSTKKQGLV